VPLINGEGELPPQAGKLLEFSADRARMSAAQPDYRKDADARRTLVVEGDKLIDTVFIESSSKTPQKLGLALHVQGEVRLPDTLKPTPDFATGRPVPFASWRTVRGAIFHDRAEFDVDYGKVIMHVTIATPGEFQLWHGDTPDIPPLRRESFYVECDAPSATFTTTFAPVAKT